MSTLPVDALPPTPTVSPYPNGIASFYYPNYLFAQAKEYDPNTPITSQFNVNSQAQSWSRALQVGENPATFRLWGAIINGTFVPNSIARTLGQAAVANLAPLNMPPTVQEALANTVYYTQPATPIPCVQPAPTVSIKPGLPGMWIVTDSAVPGVDVPQSPQEMTDSANIATILADVAAIRAKIGA